VWNADAVRDDLHASVVEHLGDPEAVLVVEETGFVKQGTKRVGVARQDSGTAGRVEHCQIGVLLVSATRAGRTLLDRELALPREWPTEAARCAAAGGPADVRVATKPQRARQLIARALAAGGPWGWVTGDAVSGAAWRMRSWREERHLSSVLGVTAQYRLFTGHERAWAAEVVGRLPGKAWRRVSCGDGRKGARVDDWVRLPRREREGERPRWLLVRRSRSDPTERAYDVGSGPRDTSLEKLAQGTGTRWAVEERFETAKGEVGLDQYAGRSGQGWYRHIPLALFAHAYLTVLRAAARAAQDEQKKGRADSAPYHKRRSCSR